MTTTDSSRSPSRSSDSPPHARSSAGFSPPRPRSPMRCPRSARTAMTSSGCATSRATHRVSQSRLMDSPTPLREELADERSRLPRRHLPRATRRSPTRASPHSSRTPPGASGMPSSQRGRRPSGPTVSHSTRPSDPHPVIGAAAAGLDIARFARKHEPRRGAHRAGPGSARHRADFCGRARRHRSPSDPRDDPAAADRGHPPPRPVPRRTRSGLGLHLEPAHSRARADRPRRVRPWGLVGLGVRGFTPPRVSHTSSSRTPPLPTSTATDSTTRSSARSDANDRSPSSLVAPRPRPQPPRCRTHARPASEARPASPSPSALCCAKASPWIPVSGELHYSRMPRSRWGERARQLRAGGITIAASYVFWIHHVARAAVLRDSTDSLDVAAFVDECAAAGLDVALRIGPWAHGEIRNGGLPDWVQTQPVEHRTTTRLPRARGGVVRPARRRPRRSRTARRAGRRDPARERALRQTRAHS